MRVSAQSIQWRLGLTVPFVVVLALVRGSDVVAQTPKAKTDARCRVYATEAVATSSGGPSTVVTTYRGTHDPATHTTTYKVTYTDSAGPKFAYVQTTVYPSTASYDVDGNPLQAIQRYGGREVTTITKLVSTAEVCEPTK